MTICQDEFSNTVISESREDNRKLMRELVKHCQGYMGADTKRSLIELTITVGGYFALCAIMLYSYVHGAYGIAALLTLPASGFLVRAFIIQHDCGHGSFFRSPRLNNWVGRCLSVLTITPYDFWRMAHAMHHAASGNLNGRGIGSIDTLTVKEFAALPKREQFIYRIYRSSFGQVVILPILYIFIVQRFPPSQSLPFLKEYNSVSLSKSWRSIVSLDIALVVCFSLLVALVGWKAVLFCYLPVVMITAWIGGWLFFVQHQFEDAYWEHDDEWNFQEASIMGSSYYILPPLLQWFTGNIGIHHIHHVCPLIPNYKLQACLDGNETLQGINRMTFRQSLQCLRWKLWDEDQKKMVGFSGV